MVSVAAGGTADRITARILFKVLRAGSGTRQGIHRHSLEHPCDYYPDYLFEISLFSRSGSLNASLHNGCGYPLDWLFRRSQRDQGYTDDNEGSHAQQFSAWDQIAECLHSHNASVGKARPRGEGNEAAVRGGLRAASSKKTPSVT